MKMMWLSRLQIELQSSSKNQKNPHTQLIWGGINFQTSIYHSFPLKPGCVKNTPLPHENSVAQLLIELQSSSKNQKNPHGQLIWGGDTFQRPSYNSFRFKPGRVKNTPSLMKIQWLSMELLST